MKNGARLIMLGGLMAIAACRPAAAQTPQPHMALKALDELEPGLWQLDVKGKPPKLLCMTDPMVFIQLAHSAAACSRFVIANDPHAATVHYSCQSGGWGQTTVRAETSRVAHIDTQGILNRAPFQYEAEARKVGICTGEGDAGK